MGQEDREGESQSSKRSRSSGSDSDSGNQQVKKKARIVDSDSDDDRTPQAAAATGMCRACLWLTSGSQAQAPSLARTLDLQPILDTIISGPYLHLLFCLKYQMIEIGG